MDAVKIVSRVKQNPAKNSRVLTCRIAGDLWADFSLISKEEKLRKGQLIEELVEDFVSSYKKVVHPIESASFSKEKGKRKR